MLIQWCSKGVNQGTIVGADHGGRFNITIVFPDNGKQCLLLLPRFQLTFSNGASTCVSQWRYERICHCLGLGHETMVCTACLFIFLSICDLAGLLRGTSLSWRFSPRTPVTDMQHYYHVRYRTDDFHRYTSQWLCLRGFDHHSVCSWLGPCVSFDATHLHGKTQYKK